MNIEWFAFLALNLVLVHKPSSWIKRYMMSQMHCVPLGMDFKLKHNHLLAVRAVTLCYIIM